MKTKEQIKAWLESQPWYEKFRAHTIQWADDSHLIETSEMEEFYGLGVKPDHVERTLTGRYGSLTILKAFENWRDTPEGLNYWLNVQKKFNEWFND